MVRLMVMAPTLMMLAGFFFYFDRLRTSLSVIVRPQSRELWRPAWLHGW